MEKSMYKTPPRARRAPMLRRLPLLAALACPAASGADPASAEMAALLQQLQERLTRLEQRNADLEKRLIAA